MEGTWTLVVLFTTTLLAGTRVKAFTIDEETRLRSDKLTNYSVDVRPSGQTTIQLSFQLTAISNVDLRNQIFSVAGWWAMHWTDSRLAWTQSDYDNIPVIQIFEDKLWTPTIVVDNSVNDLSAIDEEKIPLRVDSMGTVNWNPPGLVSVNCDMDITNFPFDTQTCALQITSFGYTIQELDVETYGDGISLTYFSGDGEWDILKTWNERATYEEGNYEYARVYYYFKLKRKPLYYGLNMLLPVIVTAMLINFVFLLPAESGEKIGYCLTVLLAFMVILTLIAADLPTTAANTSLLELYIAVVLIAGALSVILSIYVLEIFHRADDEPIPGYVKTLTLLGMRINCYRTSACCCKERVEPEEDYMDPGPRFNGQNNGRPYFSNGGYDAGVKVKSVTSKGSNAGGHPVSVSKPAPAQLSRKHTSLSLRPVTPQSSADDVTRGGEITWQTVSIVLDGILLRFYFLFLTVSSVVFIVLLAAS